MRILVVGQGGREHAIAWKLLQSATVSEVFVAPGNGGMDLEKVTKVAIEVHETAELVNFARANAIDLVVPGPELPLVNGLSDALAEAGIACFGPSKYCAQLEGSKSFAKNVMTSAGVPCAHSAHFSNYDEALSYVEKHGAPIVIKADGLAAGKGVVVAQSLEEAKQALEFIMKDKAFGDAGATVIIEECLFGQELSFLCFCDGTHAIALPSAQDHKAIFDGDKGPNTGGMGAYSPAPLLSEAAYQDLLNAVITPILKELNAAGHPYKGILYAGIMMTEQGPKVLEYNCRFGDPECQPLLMRLETPLDQIMQACAQGKLTHMSVEISNKATVGVVLAAEGYPQEYAKGMEITGIDAAEALGDVKVFHSGTKFDNDKLVANGGRVLCVTALGDDLHKAQEKAYAAVAKIQMDKSYFRKDIAEKGLKQLKNKDN